MTVEPLDFDGAWYSFLTNFNHNEIHNLYNVSMYKNHIHEITSQQNSKILTIHENWPPRIK